MATPRAEGSSKVFPPAQLVPSSKHATLALVQDLGVAHEHSSSMPSA